MVSRQLAHQALVRGSIDHGLVELSGVMYAGDGPSVGHLACLIPRGQHTGVNTYDADLMQTTTQEEFWGRRASTRDSSREPRSSPKIVLVAFPHA